MDCGQLTTLFANPTVEPVPEDLLAFDKNAKELNLEQLKFVDDHSSQDTRLTFPS